MEINCGFRISQVYSEFLYTCQISDTDIIEKDHVIKEFKGDHKEGHCHDDVKCVCFFNTKVNYFPRDLEKHFPNLTQVILHGGGIKEISNNDLKGLEGLTGLYIGYCELTTLPDDLFTEMPNLREVFFCGNKIEFASSNLLKPLLGRENVRVSLVRNKKIDAKFCPGWSNSLESFEDLMKLIDEKCIKPVLPMVVPDLVDFDPILKEMWISGNFSDLTSIAGNDKKFKVHKNILMFAEMFEDQKEANEIKIPNFSANAVEALLRFIYTNESDFEIADKFKVAEMKSIYEKIIFNQLDDSNAEEIFLFAYRHSSQLLMEKAFHFIAEKFPDLPIKILEDPEKLKKLIDARRDLDELLEDN